MTPYEPRGTFLGASTTAYRDPRSVESLVDFAQGNLKWVRDVDTEASAHMRKRQRLSEFAPGTSMDDEDMGLGNGGNGIPIDPALDAAMNDPPNGNTIAAAEPGKNPVNQTAGGFTAVNSNEGRSSPPVSAGVDGATDSNSAMGAKQVFLPSFIFEALFPSEVRGQVKSPPRLPTSGLVRLLRVGVDEEE